VTLQRRLRFRYVLSITLLGHALATIHCLAQNDNAASIRDQELNREFQAAVTQYDKGNFSDAAAQLEKLLRQVPDSFEAQELLGMVYAGGAQDVLAHEHLDLAVRLKPACKKN